MFAWRALPPRPGFAAGAYLAVPALESTGIRVAFTTRHGGASGDPFASLNLSFVSGDDGGVVRANRGRALAAIGADAGAWTSGRQVHGARVARVEPAERGSGASSPEGTIPETDALWTDEPGAVLAVLVADCLPILVADVVRRRIGVIHAGWRGLAAGVIGAAIDAIGEPARLAAFVGPSIGPCCYEVGADVAEAVARATGDEVVRGDGRPRLDLWSGATRALHAAGVREIRPSSLCTRCEPHRFFSHRAGHAARQGLVATLS